MKILIDNVNIISPYDIKHDYSLLIDKGKIAKIEKKEKIDKKGIDTIIDGEGKLLAPGFIDIHNHGNSGYDIMDSSEETIDKMAEFHLKNGVTSFLGTVITSSYENISKAIDNIVKYNNKNDKAQILGIHLEGPFFSQEKKGAQPSQYIKRPNMEDIKELVQLSDGKMKMVSLAPEIEGALGIISFLRSKGITVAMAHSNSTFQETIRGIDYGATVATHLFNGMRNFTHREPGIIGASLIDDRVFCEIIYDRIHLHDAAVKLALKIKGIDKIVLVSDAMRAAGLEDGVYELGGQKVTVKEGAARLKNGSLAGSTLNLRDAVYNMVHFLNISIQDVIRMASLSPAKAIGVDNMKGSIEIGKDADLILLDKNINIAATIVGGNFLWIEK
ncbi:N-acetylglucosamine-6-phosphate deacetylase [[Clostridium] ultunense Esp]|uniref:N-acetylglucosamine-6-phosphate deacetylase n=1 Tax=[Clostridium] ultunense Esp TaxID=1288971 RepID=M1ZB45_9FIRM|nr:N-acetylglucosamine-6-phosphate deacetylase [Schnuerera ultunensis]CCQ95546.1 N-acetylglucosamine-6-phosphate deacetylase [[Clostridium] ultunense Esp]SHD77880.1 N-acetylglucosamine-6-phosphate deacetylase [[Clostridium] ultunense Esp]